VTLRFAALLPVALALVACGSSPPPLAAPDAAQLIAADPAFAKTVARFPLADDIVDSSIGVDAGVVDGLWRIERDATGKVRRRLTAKGAEHFKDTEGTLVTPARRELGAVGVIREDPADEKHRLVDFTWHYQMSDVARRYTGWEGDFKGTAALRYRGGRWTLENVTFDDTPTSFRWDGDLADRMRELLNQEAEAATQRSSEVEARHFEAPDGHAYDVTVSDADVAVDETKETTPDQPDTSRTTVSYLDFAGCAVERAGGAATLRIDGIRTSARAQAREKDAPVLESLCTTAQQARQSWAQRHKDVAERGPLGLSYAR